MTFLFSLQQRIFARWSEKSRNLSLSDIQSISLLIIIVCSLTLGISFATSSGNRTAFGSQLGADFGAYYVAGKIYNSEPPERIYDRQLHHEIYHQVFPNVNPNAELPYVNAPFLVLPFSLLARFQYPLAYLLWLLVSLVLFAAGFHILWGVLDLFPGGAYLPVLLLSLSFMPFLVECLAGGQTSALAFFSISAAIVLEKRGCKALSGAVLSFCLYKPTLLLLALPMLLITRRYRTIAGFAAGSVLLSLVSLMTAGWDGCMRFVRMLLFFAGVSTGERVLLRSSKYIDVNSFFRMLFGELTLLKWICTLAVFLCILPWIIGFWRKQGSLGDRVWVVTLTWTLILNLYIGIYDATLAVPALLVMTNNLMAKPGGTGIESFPGYRLLLTSVYVTPWITYPFASVTGIQLFTIALASMGIYQLRQLRQFRDC